MVRPPFRLHGRLERFTRNEAAALVESFGVAPAGWGRETIAVVGQAPGSKDDEARRRGIGIVDERAFVDMLRRTGARV